MPWRLCFAHNFGAPQQKTQRDQRALSTHCLLD
jgi:hypothetical protein